MGKGRPDMMDIDRVTKKKKKVSEGKVTKHEGKHKKPVRQFKLEDSDDESSKVGLESPKQAPENALALLSEPSTLQGTNPLYLKESVDQEGGASLFQGDEARSHIEYLESREGRMQRKKDSHFREEALKRLMGEDLNTPSTASDLHVATEAERKRRKKNEKRNAKRTLERQMAKQAAVNALGGSASTDEDDTFMTDAKPKPSNLEELQCPPSEDEDMEDGGAPLSLSKREPGYTAPPSGVNRANRRRFMLIERERRKIKKALGVSEASDEKSEEVRRLLDEFTEKLDAQTAERDTRKKDRKKREAARLCDKRGRLSEKSTMKERRLSRDN